MTYTQAITGTYRNEVPLAKTQRANIGLLWGKGPRYIFDCRPNSLDLIINPHSIVSMIWNRIRTYPTFNNYALDASLRTGGSSPLQSSSIMDCIQHRVV